MCGSKEYRNMVNGMNVRMKKWMQRTAVTAAILLVMVCVVYLLGHTQYLAFHPFDNTLYWEAPSYLVRQDDTVFIVDSSKTRITVLDAEGKISAVLNGNGGTDSFSNTDYIACDGTYLYVADVVYAASGTRVSEEHIKRFTADGSYVDTVFSVFYEDGKENMPAQNGYVCWMGAYENTVYYIYMTRHSLSVNRITGEETECIREFAGDIPEVWNIAYDAANDTIYMVQKDSLVYRESGSRFVPVEGVPYDKGSIYSDIDAYGGVVYATDIGMCRVVSITDGTYVFGGEDPAENTLVYRVSAGKDGVAVTDNMLIYTVDASGSVVFSSDCAEYSDSFFGTVRLAWISLVVTIAGAVAFLTVILVNTIRNKRSKYTSLSLIVAGAVLLSTAVIATTVLTETFSRLIETSYSSLIRTADVISASSSVNGIGDAVKEINSIEDYGSEAHLFIQQYLDAYCDAAYNSGSNMYYVLFKFNDDLVYGIADYEKTAGAIYPYCPYEGSDYQTVAETGEIVSVAASMDAYGAWSYAVTPIFDSDGNVSAVAEFGINMQTEQAQNYELIKSIIIRAAVIVLLILLLIIEGTVLLDGIAGFRHEKNPDIPYFLRPMMFLTFFASNLSAAFIPQMSLVLYEGAEMGFSSTLASALPMSLQLFATALAALTAGKLLERYSMKVLCVISCLIQIAGYITIAWASINGSYIPFSIGHLISGIGIGIIIVSLNTLPDRIPDDNLRNSYYAGLNAGIISGVVIGSSIGSYISDFFGQASVFMVGAAVVVFIGIMAVLSVNGGHMDAASAEERGESRISTWKFLFSGNVLSFVICVMIPLLILMYFKDYLFPMYGYSIGMDDVSIGNILLIAGSASIIFGTTISEWLFKYCKTTGSVIISSVLTCATLVMFGMFPSVDTAVAAVVILSLSAGFGLAGQEVFYSSLPEFKSYGAQRSMSIYSICDNIAQTIGPLLMGGLLYLGYSEECLFLGTGGLMLLAVFILVRLISKMKRK